MTTANHGRRLPRTLTSTTRPAAITTTVRISPQTHLLRPGQPLPHPNPHHRLRYVIADPDAMLLTYKEGSAAGEVKGTFSLVGVSISALECEEPNAFELTGRVNGVEEKLVLACPDEGEGQRWIAGLNKFKDTGKIKEAKREVRRIFGRRPPRHMHAHARTHIHTHRARTHAHTHTHTHTH